MMKNAIKFAGVGGLLTAVVAGISFLAGRNQPVSGINCSATISVEGIVRTCDLPYKHEGKHHVLIAPWPYDPYSKDIYWDSITK